ncbi:hypothetical protein BC831DRAFT_395298 [Entophlyctis helioformis]|nr:hypothetical protein BC831DRAFT_395298 [Entophlyctis helioformis]
MASRLLGKTVLITGASAGIGEACAVEFAKAGSHLILAARRSDRIQSIADAFAKDYPTIRVLPVTLDVRDRQQVLSTINNLPADFRNIDVLVNNAGLVIGVDHVESVTEDAVNTMFDTNVKGLLNVTQAVLPIMKARNSGHIVNIGSIAGTEAYPGGGIYCASKHAVDAITRSLRMELISTNINVTSIEPGLVETEFSVVRFGGDKSRADSVYKGLVPLNGTDIAETIVFATSRRPHVQISSMVVFPTRQASVAHIHRDSA